MYLPMGLIVYAIYKFMCSGSFSNLLTLRILLCRVFLIRLHLYLLAFPFGAKKIPMMCNQNTFLLKYNELLGVESAVISLGGIFLYILLT